MSKAFTLIELLVVVLIIGILSAIALPQYQKAVDRARFVETMTGGDALINAEKIYYLANGKYTNQLSELDISLPGEVSANGQSVNFGKSTCILYYNDESGASDSVWCWGAYDRVGFRVFFRNINNRYCMALHGDERAIRICKSMTKSTGVEMSENMYYAL